MLEAGPAVTMTTLTDMAAFAAGTLTVLPAIEQVSLGSRFNSSLIQCHSSVSMQPSQSVSTFSFKFLSSSALSSGIETVLLKDDSGRSAAFAMSW